MTESYNRILTIVRTDAIFRLRRTSAMITLLIIAASVYLIVPAVETGRTLMQVEGRRVLYNSTAVALGTSMFCSLFVSMCGYYFVSNSFRRDILSRTGFIVAAAPVTDLEYIVGKFFGSVLYLLAIMLTCMASAMVMFLLRGEGSLEPLTFLSIYIAFVVPALAFSAAIAVAFEALPSLSGRFGDVLYFFVWAGMLGTLAAYIDKGDGSIWARMLDYVGIGSIIGMTRDQFHTTSMSIGASDFNASKPPIFFPGIEWTWKLISIRLASLILPAVLVLATPLWFHRFNPTRIKSLTREGHRNILAKINRLLRQITQFIQRLPSSRGRKISLWNAVRADVMTTFVLSPLTVVAILVFAILSAALEVSAMREGLLPVIVVALILALADIATRDQSSRMMSLLCTAPTLKKRYIGWKFVSALIVTLCFTLIPIFRLMLFDMSSAVSLCIGSCFMASGAIGLGVLVRNQKLYIALFLMLLYIALNASTDPYFDFAGFLARATTLVKISYAFLTILTLFLAHTRYSSLLKKG